MTGKNSLAPFYNGLLGEITVAKGSTDEFPYTVRYAGDEGSLGLKSGTVALYRMEFEVLT